MIKKIINKKAGISYLEIFILMISFFAFSYLIYSETNVVSEVIKTENIKNEAIKNNLKESIKNSLIDLVNNGMIKSVSAQGEGLGCCERTKDGKICQSAATSECDTKFNIAPTECEETGFCEYGCCISPTDGICNRRVPKGECLSMNGTYSPGISCNVQACTKGCCIIGNQAEWITEKTCKFKTNSQNKDIPTNWRLDDETNSELKCLFSVHKEQEGACVYKSGEEKKCILTTLYDCIERTGSENNFAHNGTFCSDPVLNTTCKAKDHKGCITGKEDLYWFDSCGNHEEIAQDCDITKGNYCGKQGTEYICKDINCNVNGVKRLNGESWCTYDGAIGVDEEANKKDLRNGYGRDPVGSRHVKHICYMGTERIEPCADFRNEICVQEDSTTKNGEAFSQANCRINNWRKCIEINTKKQNVDDMKKKCKENPDCFVKEINMAGSFHFFTCLPAYPPGFSLDENYTLMNGMEMPSSSEAICSIATQTCTETWICCTFGCSCVDNCLCHTNYFTQKMNEFCISLGDCGSYINYIGTYTNAGYGLRSNCASGTCGAGAPRFKGDSNGYSKNAGPQANQKPAKPGDYEFFETLNPDLLRDITPGENMTSLTAFQRELLDVSGAMGSPYLVEIMSRGENDTGDVGSINARPVSLGGYYNGYAGIKSMISSQIVKKETKAGGMEMIAALIAGLIAYMITQSLIISLLAAMLAYLMFLCWVVYSDINFICDTWEQPDGGQDCNTCNKKEVPCTKYRCQSLGAQCQFINEGTPEELCINRPENASLPVINPLYSVINTSAFNYYNVQSNGFEIVNAKDNGCVEAYSVVRMGIKIDPFAKCKFGTDPNQKYEEMPDDFGIKGNKILPVHQMDLFFPSPEAFKTIYENLTDEQIKILGNIDLYVKCKTANGKVNPESYHIKACIKPGPDLTAPRILNAEPTNNAYVKYDIDSQYIKIFTDEPSDCRWSSENKESYGSMENSFMCEKNPRKYTIFGLACNTTLTGLKNNTKFYFKCKDKPWADESERNTMKENYEYNLQVSKSELFIEDLKPANEDEIIANAEPISFKLKLKTSGGAEDGVSTCKWSGNGYSDIFTETNSTIHSYDLNQGMRGKYNITFICEDIAGNIAQNSTSFVVSVDKYGPQIIRVYYDGGLKIMTDTTSECVYSFDRTFEYENATAMSGSGNEHFSVWEPRTYYIQCKDELGNKGGKMTVRPYDIYSTMY